jgi:hypothetical protein
MPTDSFYNSTVGSIFEGRNQYTSAGESVPGIQYFSIALNNTYSTAYKYLLSTISMSHSVGGDLDVLQEYSFGSWVESGRISLKFKKTSESVTSQSGVVSGGTGTSSITCNNFTSYSDARIKKNIETLSENQGVDNIRVVQYNSTSDDTKHFGVIAHELAEIYPDLVSGEKDGKEMQAVTYIELIPLCINEIQKLKRENLSLLSRLETLERKMNDLTS